MQALQLFNVGETSREFSCTYNITHASCYRINSTFRSDDELAFNYLIQFKNNREKRRAVLSADEDELMKKRMKYAAARGFALDKYSMRKLMGRITTNGGRDLKSRPQKG